MGITLLRFMVIERLILYGIINTISVSIIVYISLSLPLLLLLYINYIISFATSSPGKYLRRKYKKLPPLIIEESDAKRVKLVVG